MSTREIISPSFLAGNYRHWQADSPEFSLGISDWADNDDKEIGDFQPPKKKMCKDQACKVAAKDCFGECTYLRR